MISDRTEKALVTAAARKHEEIGRLAKTQDDGGLRPFVSAKRSREIARLRAIENRRIESMMSDRKAELAKPANLTPAITPAPMTAHRAIPFFGIASITWRYPEQEEIERTFRSYRNAPAEIRRGMREQLEAMKTSNARAKQYRRQLLKRMSDVDEPKQTPRTHSIEIERAFRHYKGQPKHARAKMLKLLEAAEARSANARRERAELLRMIHELEAAS